MRVTKTIREYIEKAVTEKVTKRYEVEAEEAKRQADILNEYTEKAEQAAIAAAVAVYEEAKNKYEEIISLDVKEYKNLSLNGVRWAFDLNPSRPCSDYRSRMKKEINEKVQDIIVTLELGGNKADLDRMLSEI